MKFDFNSCRAVRNITFSLLLIGFLSCRDKIDEEILKGSEILIFQPSVSPPEIYRYQSSFRGSLPPSNKMNFVFGVNGKGTARFRIQFVGIPDDSVMLQAVDRGSKMLNCRVENVPDRIGCIIKAETEGRQFLLSIERSDKKETMPVELYIFAESQEQMSFYRTKDSFL